MGYHGSRGGFTEAFRRSERRASEGKLSFEDAAEYYWSLFVHALQ